MKNELKTNEINRIELSDRIENRENGVENQLLVHYGLFYSSRFFAST